MLLSLITIYPLPENESKIIEVLDSIQALLATNADCLACIFTAATGAASKSICYMERWRTREALDRHLRSHLYYRVLEAMELSRKPPTVEFSEMKDIGGLEMIADARLHQ